MEYDFFHKTTATPWTFTATTYTMYFSGFGKMGFGKTGGHPVQQPHFHHITSLQVKNGVSFIIRSCIG